MNDVKIWTNAKVYVSPAPSMPGDRESGWMPIGTICPTPMSTTEISTEANRIADSIRDGAPW